MADEAGVSRLYGGIHYPSDIDEGKAHGDRIGAWVRERGEGGRAPTEREVREGGRTRHRGPGQPVLKGTLAGLD